MFLGTWGGVSDRTLATFRAGTEHVNILGSPDSTGRGGVQSHNNVQLNCRVSGLVTYPHTHVQSLRKSLGETSKKLPKCPKVALVQKTLKFEFVIYLNKKS